MHSFYEQEINDLFQMKVIFGENMYTSFHFSWQLFKG